jgi:hypothetical protein
VSQGTHSARLAALMERLGPALEIDEHRLLAEMLQTAIRLEAGEGFNCEAVVSMKDGRPLIDCAWMGMLAQISPEQARSMAAGLVETASEAETDAVTLAFFRETGLPDEKAAAAVYQIRQLRRQRQSVVGEKQEPVQGHPLTNVVPFGAKPS